MMTTQTTLSDFINRNEITLSCERVDRNPSFPDDAPMDHYKVRLHNGLHERQMTLIFSMGFGLRREPNAMDVLQCLADDSASVENTRDVQDWCRDCGYDPDSRKAERIFRNCEKQARKLKRFLGDVEYDNLLWKTEREQ